MPRSTWWIGLLALATRVALMQFESGMTYDGTYYLRQAERLAAGNYEWVGFPPGYPLAIAALQWLVGGGELAARLVSLAAGVGTVVVFHVWAHRSLESRLATLASVVLALHPELVRASTQTLSESLYLFLVLVGVVCSERRVAWASVALGLAFLCRPEAVLVLAGLPMLFWLRDRARPRAPWMLGAGCVVVYAVIASVAVGHPVLSPKQGQLDLGADVVERTWTTLRMTYAVFPLILLPGALWMGVRSRRECLIPCLYLLALPLYDIHVQQRMLLPALPFLFLLAGLWLHSITGTPRRVLLAASGLLLLLGTYPTWRTLGSRGIVTPRAPEIGAALASHLDFDDRVAGRFPFVAYYAGAGFVRMPLADYGTLMNAVADMGATHLVVLESEMQNITPHLEPLFDDAVFTAAEGRLQAVAWVDEPPGHRAILYRMREPDLSESNAPVLRDGVQGVAWMGDDLVIATRAGLERIPVHTGVSVPDTANAQRLVSGPVLDPVANPDGTRVAFVRPDGSRTLVSLYDTARDEFTSFDGTSQDRPVSPAFVDDNILYVRTESPGGLRLLNPETGRVRDVALEGLSSADATPLAVTAREHDLAMTYVRTRPRTPRHRVIATATWPALIPSSGVIEVMGKWATELSLTDDRLAWLPGERRVLASIGIRILDAEGNTAKLLPSLAVVHSSAVYRRLSFDLQSVRRPAHRDTRLVFLTGEGDLRSAWLEPVDTEIPRTRVYDSVLQAP